MSESCGKVTTRKEDNVDKESAAKRPTQSQVVATKDGKIASRKNRKSTKEVNNRVNVNKASKEKPKNPVGILNRPPSSPVPVQESLDTKNETSVEALRKTVVQTFGSAAVKEGDYIGIVLAKISSLSKEYSDHTNSYVDKKSDNPQVNRLKTYKIRIPELDAMLEEPQFAPFNEEEAIYQRGLIYLHRTFVSEKEDTPEPTVGEKVRVRVAQGDSYIYLGPVENRTKQSALKSSTKGEAKSAFKKPPKKETAQPASKQRIKENKEEDKKEVKSNPKHKIVKAPVDFPRTPGASSKFPPGGKDSVRSDLADRHAKVKEILNALGCTFHSSGSGRGLGSKPKSSAQILTSFHYTGTAIDLNNNGMSHWNLKKRENYVELLSNTGNRGPYLVWARTDTPQATFEYEGKVYKPQEITIKKLIIPAWNKPQKIKKNYKGTFVNLTEIMKDVMKYDPIRSRSTWWTTGKPGMGGEYWHFDGRKTLGIEIGTRWEDFLKEVFELSKLKGKPTYETGKNAKFKGGGFY